MKKQYITAFILMMAIMALTNTDFYKKNVMGIDPELEAQKKLLIAEKKNEAIKEEQGSVVDESTNSTEDAAVLTKTVYDTVIIKESPSDTATVTILEKQVAILPKTYTVTNEKLSVEFSSKGAVITKVTLNDYTDNNGNPVVLFKNNSINSISINKKSDKDYIYKTYSDSVISVKGSDSLIFFYNEGKLSIKKIYTFDSTYMINVALKMANSNFIEKYTLNWDSPIEFNDREDKNHVAVISYLNGDYEDNTDEEITTPFSNISDFWIGYRVKYFWGSFVFANENVMDGKITSKSKMDEDKTSVKGYFKTEFELSNDRNKVDFDYGIFFSPLDKEMLSSYGHNLDKSAEFGMSIVKPLSNLVMMLLHIMHKFISNWGVIIVIFSLLLKLLLYPLNKKTIQSSTRMQEVQPKIQEINKKFANDPQRKMTEIQKLYKEEGVSPFGSCLPMLVQMPIFFAMYATFRGAIEFRQAPFVGWITDLSQPESLYAMKFMSFEFHLGILVFISSIAMFFQMKMTMKDPKQKAMPYMMGIFMFFIFSGMSSGLNLYWATFNTFQFVQQLLIEKSKKKTVVVRKK